MSINILLADDSITIQKVIGIIFGGENYSLTIVSNGTEVLEKARQRVPDILLIDALMPGKSGYEVCEQVRATPELAQKPILLLTGSFEPFDEEKAKSCGADDFIAKPFESQQIIAKVKELCDLAAVRSPQSAPVSATSSPDPFVAPAIQAAAAAQFEDDIWGAFTAASETTAHQPASSKPENLEPDVFNLINEEPDVFFAPPPPPPPLHTTESTASQWDAVDENFFEFTEETTLEEPPATFTPSPTSTDIMNIGDIPFEDRFAGGAHSSLVPGSNATDTFETGFPEITAAFDEPHLPEFEKKAVVPPAFPQSDLEMVESPATPTAFADHVQHTSPASEAAAPLSEEQIKGVIASLSKEVIERIVWEVVPDLAENLIMEAIRKIKEGR